MPGDTSGRDSPLGDRTYALGRKCDVTGPFIGPLRALVRPPPQAAGAGCEPLIAASLIGSAVGAQRFPIDAPFAGRRVSRRPQHPLGNTVRHRLHRGGADS